MEYFSLKNFVVWNVALPTNSNYLYFYLSTKMTKTEVKIKLNICIFFKLLHLFINEILFFLIFLHFIKHLIKMTKAHNIQFK